jgi:hypothetical protein
LSVWSCLVVILYVFNYFLPVRRLLLQQQISFRSTWWTYFCCFAFTYCYDIGWNESIDVSLSVWSCLVVILCAFNYFLPVRRLLLQQQISFRSTWGRYFCCFAFTYCYNIGWYETIDVSLSAWSCLVVILNVFNYFLPVRRLLLQQQISLRSTWWTYFCCFSFTYCYNIGWYEAIDVSLSVWSCLVVILCAFNCFSPVRRLLLQQETVVHCPHSLQIIGYGFNTSMKVWTQ